MAATFEIYKPDGTLVVSPSFKLPQTNLTTVTKSFTLSGSYYYTVHAAFDPRATSGTSVNAFPYDYAGVDFKPLVENKTKPLVWYNYTANVPFSPLIFNYTPSSQTYPTRVVVAALAGAATLRVRATSLDDSGTYSSKYLAVYDANGELTWSVDKITKSPRILGRLVIPAASRNSLTSYGFLALPAGIDLTRVYILPNMASSYVEFNDAPAGWVVTGISYCITSAGVYGRYFSKGGSYSMLLQDAVVLVAYI